MTIHYGTQLDQFEGKARLALEKIVLAFLGEGDGIGISAWKPDNKTLLPEIGRALCYARDRGNLTAVPLHPKRFDDQKQRDYIGPGIDLLQMNESDRDRLNQYVDAVRRASAEGRDIPPPPVLTSIEAKHHESAISREEFEHRSGTLLARHKALSELISGLPSDERLRRTVLEAVSHATLLGVYAANLQNYVSWIAETHHGLGGASGFKKGRQSRNAAAREDAAALSQAIRASWELVKALDLPKVEKKKLAAEGAVRLLLKEDADLVARLASRAHTPATKWKPSVRRVEKALKPDDK